MLLHSITHDPAIIGGKPCIRGMRITVGRSIEELLFDYPYIERENIFESMRYAENEINPRRPFIDRIAAMTPKGVKQTDSTLHIREDHESWK